MNVNKLANKLNYVFNLIHDFKLDCISITETWLTKDCSTSFVDLDGFNFFRGDTDSHVGKHGAGLYVSVCYSAHKVEVDLPNLVVVYIKELNIYVFSVYRPPSYEAEQNRKLCDFLMNFSVGKDILVLGDFNLPSVVWDQEQGFNAGYVRPVDRLFLDCFAACGLTQYVLEGTFFPSGNTLDLVLSSEEGRILDVECGTPFPGCHHCPVVARMVYQFAVPEVEKTDAWSWSKGDYDSFSDALFEVDWELLFDGLNSSDCYHIFCAIVLEMVPEFVPKQGLRRKDGWLARPPGSLVRRLKSSWRRFKELRAEFGRSHSVAQEAFNVYREVNLEYKNYSRLHQEKHEKRLIELLPVAPKAFHSYLRSRKKGCPSVGPLKDTNGNVISEQERMSAIFAEAFTSIYIEDRPRNPHVYQSSTAAMVEITLSYEVVFEKLKGLNASSSAGPDGIHPRVLFSYARVLALPLSIIFTRSLNEGILPDAWKLSRVVPIFKEGSKASPLNYRPVSMTSMPCKVMERILVDHIVEYLEENSLLANGQFGFRQGRGVEDQLLLMYGEVVNRVDSGEVVDVVYLDFSKAFDVVNHEVMIEKLALLGFSPQILSWVRAFLVGRRMFVSVGSGDSALNLVKSGVPQGSVLGPLLFLIYVNTLAAGLNCKWYAYADDFKLYSVGTVGSVNILQGDLDIFADRAASWNLNLNLDKCVVMRFGVRGIERDRLCYNLRGQSLSFVESHKDLGIVVDVGLRFHLHVSRVVRKANGLLNQLLSGTVCRESGFMVTLFVSHIRPMMDFGARLWNVGYLGDVRKLERIQRRWLMQTTGMADSRYGERLQALRLFSVHGRLLRGDLIKIWQVFHPCVDLGLGNLFDLQSHAATRSNGFKLAIPRCRSEIRRRFWSVRCVLHWNSLPADVVQASNLETFKRRLDTHMGDLFYRTVDNQ